MAASEVVRLCTMGSVDDGKSTLIGRLLHDCRIILDDQLASLREASARRGLDGIDLSLLTDGLRAEREQGITIDVAYRYFATPRRRFILADTPGHVQYTRNTVTGASTARVALLLVDAKRGIGEQARRHAFVASLLGVPHVAVCVNKMDLVGWSEGRFDELRREFAAFASRLAFAAVEYVPLSALHGDNVVSASRRMPWYEGPTLLSYLEQVRVAADPRLDALRLPVQYVIREPGVSGGAGRWYAGQIVAGTLRAGDAVTVLPSGLSTGVTAVATSRAVEAAAAPLGVRVRLADDLDVSRGDMLVGRDDLPSVARDLDVVVCSLWNVSLREGARLVALHTTRATPAVLGPIRYRIDVNTLARDGTAREIGFNDIGRATLRVGSPLFTDPYARNRATGALALVDATTNATVAAGLVVDPTTADAAA